MSEQQTVVAAWPEHCVGPGWSNSLIWVLLRDGNGKLSIEAIQPHEQTAEMRMLFGVADAAHGALKQTVVEARKPKSNRAKAS